MCQIILSWGIIFPSLYCMGVACSCITNRLFKCKIKDLDLLLVSGIMLLTIYAQGFSLIYKVGMEANIILWLADALIIVFSRKTIIENFREVYKRIHEYPAYGLVCCATVFFMVAVASASAGENVCFDTDLYHAQAIRWIEEYGVVKGEGLFMRRLAYNSSFFSLQALFSYKWLFGQSLRNVNGLLAFIFLSYDILTFRAVWKGKLAISDALRVVSMLVVYDVSDYKSSSTDLFVMLLALYILIKYLSYIEEGEENPHKYAWLCMFAVLAATVKLSVGGLVLLSIYPIYKLIKRKNTRMVFWYVTIAIVTAIPYFARNILISGWLIYPVSAIDLFHVDWKMAKETLDADALEISMWGKEVASQPNAIELVKGFRWFPYWLQVHNIIEAVLLITDIILIPVELGYGFLKWYKSRKEGLVTFFIAINTVFLMWLLSAPLVRYGKAWLYTNCAIIIGIVVKRISETIIKTRRLETCMVCLAVMIILLCIQHNFGPLYHHENNWKQVDYSEVECVQYKLGNYDVYLSAGAGLVGYHYFPAAGSEMELNRIELRTDRIEDGFRLKTLQTNNG